MAIAKDIKVPLHKNGDEQIVLRLSWKSWLLILTLLSGVIGSGVAGTIWFTSVRDTTAKVPILEERVDTLEMVYSVKLNTIWEIQKTILREIDPDGAEGTICQIEQMEKTMIDTMAKQKEADN